jgi:hypothetical protein
MELDSISKAIIPTRLKSQQQKRRVVKCEIAFLLVWLLEDDL